MPSVTAVSHSSGFVSMSPGNCDNGSCRESLIPNTFESDNVCDIPNNEESTWFIENSPTGSGDYLLSKSTMPFIEENSECLPIPMPCLPGEVVQSTFKFLHGLIVLTNYRVAILHMHTLACKLLCYQMSTSKSHLNKSTDSCIYDPLQDECFNKINNCITMSYVIHGALSHYEFDKPEVSSIKAQFIPLPMLSKAEVMEVLCCRIITKTGWLLKLTFLDNIQCGRFCDSIMKVILAANVTENLFAFTFKTELNALNVPHDCQLAKRFLGTAQFFNVENEFERMKFCPTQWRVSKVNADFLVCRTYPTENIVPFKMKDESVKKMATFRQSNRFPTVVWRSQKTGAVMLRCAQPCVGLTGNRNNEDEKFIELVLECCQMDSLTGSSTKRLLIVDARHYSAAFYNCFRGGGFENVHYYSNVDIEWKNLPNMHSVRSSFERLILCIHSPPDQWLSAFEATDWLNFLGQLLRASNDIAQILHEKGCPVMIHCTDGWDRTPQLTSLAGIMLDPYYRSIQGFCQLIQREWLAFGHKFADRCGLRTQSADPNEISPIFLQFLDCVYQLTVQYPESFEFNQSFLIKLGNHVYSCLFGTFLCNCEQERKTVNTTQLTCSLWSFLQSSCNESVLNFLYKKSDEVLSPSWSARDLQLWRGMYLDDSSLFGDFDKNGAATSALISSDSQPPMSVEANHILCPEKQVDSLENYEANYSNILSAGDSSHNPIGQKENIDPAKLLCDIPTVVTPLNVNGMDSRKGLEMQPIFEESQDLTAMHRNFSSTDQFSNFFAQGHTSHSLPRVGGHLEYVGGDRRRFKSSEERSPHAPLLSPKSSDCHSQKSFFTWGKCHSRDLFTDDESFVESHTGIWQQVTWTIQPQIDWDGLICVSSRVNAYNRLIQELHSSFMEEKKQSRQECVSLRASVTHLQRKLNECKARAEEEANRRRQIENPDTILHSEQARTMSLMQDAMREDYDEPCSKNSSFCSFEKVDGSSLVKWFPNHACHTCEDCHAVFSEFKRRHHCRMCGYIFCDKCSNNYLPVPQQNLKVRSRVCCKCRDKLTLDASRESSSTLSPPMVSNNKIASTA